MVAPSFSTQEMKEISNGFVTTLYVKYIKGYCCLIELHDLHVIGVFFN